MPLFLAVLALGAVLLASRKGTAQSTGTAVPLQLGPNTPPSDSIFLAPPSGYRRATAAEITPLMQADASLSLALPLGTRVQRDGYAIGIESHYHPEGGAVLPWGWHKGASVYVPA